MSDANTIYIEVDGKPEPLNNILWTTWAACGCLAGVSKAARGNGEDLVTEDQVRADMRDSKVQIQRSIEDGETVRPMTWEQYRALGKWGECEHDPQWGVPVVKVPEDHVWATTDRWHYGRRSYKRHIVPATEVAPDAHSREPALCGYKPSRTANSWTTERSSFSDTVTCRPCEKRAQR